MNVLIYKFNDLEIVEKLIRHDNVSLYFAISKEDIFRIAREIKPDFMIMGNQNNLDEKIIFKFIKQNPDIHIYHYEEKDKDLDELKLTEQLTLKKVNFKTLIN